MKNFLPNIPFLDCKKTTSLLETDDFVPGGNYQAYLKSAHSTDEFIRELWDNTQANPYYRNRPPFIVTTDHGRRKEALGEVKEKEQLYTIDIVNKI